MKVEKFTTKKISVRLASYAWLVCIFCTSLTVFSLESPRSGDVVFCPLQKQWVRKNPPRAAPAAEIASFCVSEKSKDAFLGSISQKAVKINPSGGEAAFFNFLAKGERSFAEIPPLPNAPEQGFVAVTRSEATGNVSRGKIALKTAIFSFEQLSRPPTLAAVQDFPASQFFFSSTAHNSATLRGPPASL